MLWVLKKNGFNNTFFLSILKTNVKKGSMDKKIFTISSLCRPIVLFNILCYTNIYYMPSTFYIVKLP